MRKSVVFFGMLLSIFTSCNLSNEKTISKSEEPVIDAIMLRRSIRNYTDEPVTREMLQKIAECGVMTPSSHNSQTWEVRVVDNKQWIDSCSNAYIAAVKKAGKYEQVKFMFSQPYKNVFRNAPAVFFIATQPDARLACEGIGMLGENIMLAAVDLGLGTCALGTVREIFAEPGMEKYTKALEFSDGYQLSYAIAIGYPAETPAETPRDMSKIKFIE